MKRAEEHDPSIEMLSHKASALSYKRSAKTVEDNDAMFAKLTALFKEHHEKGILTTPYPSQSQVTRLARTPVHLSTRTRAHARLSARMHARARACPSARPPARTHAHTRARPPARPKYPNPQAHPPATQMYGGDEVGFDPNGKYLPALRIKDLVGLQQRSFRLQTGERAPFWVSVFFWSRCFRNSHVFSLIITNNHAQT